MIKIKVWGVIDMQTSAVFETAVSALKDKKEPILIVINSVGGSLSDSIAIRNLLDSLKNPIITVALGNCCSAAAMLFAAGKHRYVGENLTYMIHQPYLPTIETVNSHDAKIKYNKLETYSKLYIDYTIKKAKKLPQKLTKDFEDGQDLYITVEDCLKYNIATNTFAGYDNLYEQEKIVIAEEEIVEFNAIILKEEEL